jgi:predicted membrane protein
MLNTAIVLSMWLTGSTFLGGSQLTTTIQVVINWLPPGKVKPVSHMDNTIAMLMIGRSYLATT